MPRRLVALLLPWLLGLAVRAATADDVALQTAEARLQELTRVLKRTRAENPEIAEALVGVEEAYRHLANDPEPPDGNLDRWREDQDKRMERFRSRAERLFLKALGLEKVNRELDRNERHEIQFQAARALGHTRPETAPAFRRVLEKDLFGGGDYRKDPSFYDVAFRALASLGDPATFDWLLEEAVNADVNDDSQQRATAALEVMMESPDVTPEQRRATVRRLIDIYQSYAFHWQNKYDAVAGFRSGSRKFVKIAGVQGTYWMDMRPVVLRALRLFSRDPRTGLPPLDPKTGQEWETLPEWLNWYHRVGRRGMPPWIDAAREDPTGRDGRRDLDHQGPSLSIYERAFGIPWQRWWDPRSRPPRRTVAAEATPAPPEGDAAAEVEVGHRRPEERLPAVFLAALDAESVEVRAAAALGLGKTRAEGARESLVTLLARETHERVREAAVLGLLCLEDPALIERFRDLLHDPEENARCRAYAVLALGLLGEGARVWEVLGERRPALGGSPAVVGDLQACAVVAVGLSGRRELAPALMDVLASRRWDDGVRGQVGPALARLGNPDVTPDLVRLLRTSRGEEEDAPVATAAALALGGLLPPDDSRSVRQLAAPLLHPKGKFGGTRNAIALALGRIGGEEAEDALTAAWAEREKDTTRYAELGFLLLGLSALDTSAAHALVRHQMRNLEHEHDLGAAALGIATAGDRLGIAPIRERTRASEHVLTRYGLLALGMLGDEDVAELARQTLRRRHEPGLVRSALTALALLEGEGALGDLEAWWAWSRSHEHLDALAWAFVPAASPDAEALLTRWATDETLDPRRRAYALVALGRMADAEPDPVLTRIARDVNLHAPSPTLDLIARYADVPFFR